MSFSLRTFIAAGIIGIAPLAVLAQTAPASPSAVSTPATAVLAETPLLKPDQVKGEKYKAYLYKRYATDKEARAAIHLFARKQTGGALWLTTGAAFISYITAISGTTRTESGTRTVTITPLGYVAFTGLFGGVGIGKLARFNNGKLYEALLDFEKTRSFPGYVVAKLKDKDYK
jgi:hypothetical protein